MTKRQLDLLLWQKNPTLYFTTCLKIEHKGCKRAGCECKSNIGRRGPFILNRHQQKVQAVIDRQRAMGKPVRIKILKPRQTGISTICSANIFHYTRFHGGTAMTVSMDLDSSEHIHKINQRFYDYLPESEEKALPTDNTNRKEIKLSEPHGGRILVETAGKTSAGHSFTIRALHLSEISRWPEGTDDAIVGLMNAVPNEPDTIIIKESVANGMVGYFYDDWNTEDDYERVFLPASEHDEYAMPLPMPEEKYLAQLEEEEKQLISRHGLTLEQVEFRRWAIVNKCKGDADKFREQYPYTASEAFLASGNAFFHIPTVEAIETQTGLRCNLQVFEDLAKRKDTRPVENQRGMWTIFKRPEKGRQYVVGADVAEGIEIEGARPDDLHDYSSADFLDRETGEQVAHFHARVTPDEFGRQLAIGGEFYGWAYMGIENNGGYGQNTIQTMLDEKYPAHLFYRDPNTQKLGFSTTKLTRKPLCQDLDIALRSKEVFVKSEGTKKELKTFITKPDGRVEHGQGAKDDQVFSLALAVRMAEVAPKLVNGSGAPSFSTPVIKYRPSVSLLHQRGPLGRSA